MSAPLFPDAFKDELRDAGLLPRCGEYVNDALCGAPAEFILWGKLIPEDGLGPRCFDHAQRHVGADGLFRPGKTGWALADLRPLIRESGGAL